MYQNNNLSILGKPLFYALFVLLAITLIGLVGSFSLTGSNFAYALDDPYIHMSIAKNLALHFHWGVTPYDLASASSSPFWNVVLAPFYLLVGHDTFVYVPFVVNLFFQALSVVIIFMFFVRFAKIEMIKVFLFSALFVLLIPFLPLTLGGMEHSMQVALTLLFFYWSTAYFYTLDKKYLWYLAIIAPFLALTRYENLSVIVAMAAILFIFYRQRVYALILMFSGFSLIVLFGIWSVSNNLGFVPSSIMAKSFVGNEVSLYYIKKFVYRFLHTVMVPHILVLYLAMLLALAMSYFKSKAQLMTGLMVILAFSIHITFGNIGWLYRYEAYVIALAVLYVGWVFLGYEGKKIVSYLAFGIVGVVLYVLVPRSYVAHAEAIQGTKNIFEQQVQMAGFLNTYCYDCRVAAGDIGAITYFTNIDLLDMAGLGSYEVIKLQKNGQFNSQSVNAMLNREQSDLILKYDNRYVDLHFPDYQLIGQWTIQNNVVCGGETVNFYAKAEKAKVYKEMFDEYTQQRLPPDVIVTLQSLQ
jgi:hypothetical protein